MARDDLYVPTVRVRQDFQDIFDDYRPDASRVDFEKTKNRISDSLTMTIQLVPQAALKKQFVTMVIMVVCLICIMVGLMLYTMQLSTRNSRGIETVSQDRCDVVVHYTDGGTETVGPFCK